MPPLPEDHRLMRGIWNGLLLEAAAAGMIILLWRWFA